MGAKLLTVYSIGIAIPFFITALLVNTFLEHINKLQKILNIFNKIGGAILVAIGFLMATNYLAVISDKVFSSFAK
jgi:cytochrome c-type biogenesis protein